jgi:putative ABC transport system permease protein
VPHGTMTDFLRDLLYAARLIRKSPLFSLYVIAPLALGIGLNGAIFMLLDALLLRPLPVKNPANLVRVVQAVKNIGRRSYYTYDTFAALERKSTTLFDLIGYADWNVAVRDASGASRIRAQVVTARFFTALGVQPLLGRVLTEADAFGNSAAPPVVLSYAYWHGHRKALGDILTLDDRPFTIVGVMPKSFNGIDVETTPDVRVPLAEPDRKLDYSLAARLRSGVSLESARAETESIANAVMDIKERIAVRDERLEIEPVAKGVSLIRPKFATGLILLMCGVGLLLLMICANVGGLLLARASARQGETAVRLAIGATTGLLVRQWLTESLVLSGIGGLAGIAIALTTAPVLVRWLPSLRDLGANTLTLSVDLRPDARLIFFAILLCVVCALFAGLPAAVLGIRGSLHSSLKTARSTSRQPLRWTLVALQVGLCTFLIAGAALLTATFRHLRALDPGFDRDHVITFSLDPSMARYTSQQGANLEARLTARVREIPEVQSAGIAMIGLMHGTGMKTTVAAAGQITPRSDFMNTSINFVSPEYFETMGIPILEGRNFRPDEPQTKPEMVIVNRAFVRRFFPATDPIGQKFGNGTGKAVSGDNTIVGVVGDAKYRSLRENIPPTYYHFRRRDSESVSPFILHVRTHGRPEGIIQTVRGVLNSIDPRLPFYEIRTLAEEVDRTLWAERLLAWLSGVFAAIATVLAAMGVYATLAYAIAQGKREIGIRVALGAQAGDVFQLLSSRPLRFAALGVICGLAGFYAAAPAFRSVLYDTAPADPVTMGAAAIGVLAIAIAATLVAVWGALRVDPAIVLRDE